MSLFARRTSRHSVHLFPRLVALSAIVLSLCGAVITTPGAALASSATTTSALNLRYGPSLNRGVILVMPSGAPVDILGGPDRAGFYKVSYNGVTGYAHSDYITGGSGGSSSDGGGSSGGPSGDATVDSALNLRSGPSTSSSVILVMPGGASVSLTGAAQNGFLELTYQGTDGWGYGDFISAGGGSPSGGSGGAQDAGGGDAGSATTTSALNLRSGPSTSSSVILVMPSGAGVTLTGAASNGFSGVTYQGTTGWAYSDYLGSGSSGGSSSGASSGGGIVDIIYAAADRYGQSRDDMLRVATCESGLDPSNYTPPYGASGLFQFLPGTWATTPYAGYDIFDPWANANAAGWMWSVGRRGEWVCQ